jgi:hypothetical protein
MSATGRTGELDGDSPEGPASKRRRGQSRSGDEPTHTERHVGSKDQVEPVAMRPPSMVRSQNGSEQKDISWSDLNSEMEDSVVEQEMVQEMVQHGDNMAAPQTEDSVDVILRELLTAQGKSK